MNRQRVDSPNISVVVPMYNESEACDAFFETLIPILESITNDYEVICVNDGSNDDTRQVIVNAHRENHHIKLINLSRNFGKELAVTAGIEHASGNIVIPIDADLQDPPDLIPEMVERWKEGYDTVIAVRSDRRADSAFKRTSSKLFYRIIGTISDVPIPADAGDFRLIDRSVVDALKLLPERNRFMKGLFAWVGFSQAVVEYSRPERAAGDSKWKFWQLWNLALDGIFSFTTLPLRIWTYLGVAVTIFSTLYALEVIIQTLIFGVSAPGYASLIVTILFFSGLNMIGLGILGEYIGRIFTEVKQRPLYLVESNVGFSPEAETGNLKRSDAEMRVTDAASRLD